MQRDSIDFRSTAIEKLFRQFLLPTVLGMVSSAIFIITDGIFVGKGIGSDALASVNLVAPIYTLATGLGLMFGLGGSVVASINLSQGKTRVANINITQSLWVPLLLLGVITILLLSFPQPVLRMLGTPDELMIPAREYLVWFSAFLVPLGGFCIMMFVVRLDGSPRFAMGCNIAAACINIVLDYLFIFQFGWGLAGAAAATGIGYIVGMGVMFWYMHYRRQTLCFVRLKMSIKSLRLTLRNSGYMAYLGFPTLLGEMAISCLMIVGNFTFIHYVGKDGVAAYSIACYIFPIIFMVYNGILQAAQPIISYNHGAGDTDRSGHAFRLAIRAALVCGVVVCGFTWLFSSSVAAMFLSPEAPAYALAVVGLPLFALGYPFFGLNLIIIGYYQSIERGKLATGLTLLRGVVLMILCFLWLPQIWGVTGIWLAVPVSEAIQSVVLLIVLRFTRRKG